MQQGMKYFCTSSVREKSNVPKLVLMKEPVRRFPPPWTAEDNGACFIVRDGSNRYRQPPNCRQMRGKFGYAL
jgi:hypothetical protein